MSRQARILDLQTGTILKLPERQAKTIIGLTPSDELQCSTEEDLQNSEIVLDLCSIKSKQDGHWLIPSPYLPTSLNDNVTQGHVLLTTGAIIGVGDRFMRFIHSNESDNVPQDASDDVTSHTGSVQMRKKNRGESETETTGGGRDIMDIPIAMSCAFDPAVVLESMTSQARALARQSGSNRKSRVDTDVVRFLETRSGLANMTAAIVSQHIMMYTSLRLAAHEIDQLFMSFEHITTWEETCFQTFLCEYEQIFTDQDRSNQTISNSPIHKKPFCIHTPVIHLLTDLLRLTLEPIEYNILWMKILAVLSNNPLSHSPLITYKTAAAVLGCMSASCENPSLQEHGCALLARVAEYKPAHGEKGPVREGGVQLVVQALQSQMFSIHVVRQAVLCLANLLQTYSTLAMETVSTMEFVSLEDQRDILVRVMGILDFIEETAVPVVGTIPEEYLTDEIIRKNVLGILSYFHENVHDVNRSSSEGSTDEDTHVSTEVLHKNSSTQDVTEVTNGLEKSRLSSSKEKLDIHTSKEFETNKQRGTNPFELSTEEDDVRSSMIHGVEFFSEDEDSKASLSGVHGEANKSSDNSVDENDVDDASNVCQLDYADTITKRNQRKNDQKNKAEDSSAMNTTATSEKSKVYIKKAKPLHKKRNNIFDKLKRTKPKKSILCTEYTQSGPPKENVELRSTDLLYGGTVQKPEYSSSSSSSDGNFQLRASNEYDDMFNVSNPSFDPKFNNPESSDRASMSSSSTSHSSTEPEGGVANVSEMNENVSRYVKIFGRMTKAKKKHKKKKSSKEDWQPLADSRTKKPDEDEVEPAQGGVIADFMRRTRSFFKDGKGKYDITEAVRASLVIPDTRRSYLPLSLEEHGHDLSLENTGNPDVLY